MPYSSRFSMNAISPELKAEMSQRNTWLCGLTLSYVVVGYAFAIASICSQSWLINLIGVFLLIHTLIWAAYLVHEAIHGTISRRPNVNVFVGNLMLFITGSGYCRFQDLARNHLAHHKNRADFSAFSIPDFLNSLPKVIKQIIICLEWLYFPIVNFILRWLCIIAPFLGTSRKDERLRNAAIILVRGSLFLLLAWYSPKALLLYFFAYICFINLLRFIDCFQHTFQVFQLDQELPQYSLEYEEKHTYSNLVSLRIWWLNAIFLNFGYHNAHHRLISCPWYLLQKLDSQLYPRQYCQRITLNRLVRNYHRFRIYRLFNGQGVVDETESGLNLDNFVGGIGVSFLILREPLNWLKLSAVSV